MAVRISDELLVSRAEHNDGNLTSLEEISLHQQHLEKLEYINRVCATLRILLLQDNCIGKIENLGRLRSLQYLNLALNNIEVVENLENCECLEKLDLTLNFIGEITSVERLRANSELRDLMLMGNPCTKYDGYRAFVIASLPQLQCLDGEDISRTELIEATQALPAIRDSILRQQTEYLKMRQQEKLTVQSEIEKQKKEYEDPSLDVAESCKRFYESKSRHTPEYRLEASRKTKEFKDIHDKARDPFQDPKEEERKKKMATRRLFDDDGTPLNINQANLDFRYDDSHWKDLVVHIFTYKHLDTSLITLDIQPTFLRVTVKDKIFQLRFIEEVHSDFSKAERSQATGHIKVTMPKVRPTPPAGDDKQPCMLNSEEPHKRPFRSNLLEIETSQVVNLSNIVKHDDVEGLPNENDVPPLEDAP